MFDNLLTANNNQNPAKVQPGSVPPPRPTVPKPPVASVPGLAKAPVEDIYSGTDKTVLGAINKNIPRPPVLQPKTAPGVRAVGAAPQGFDEYQTSGVQKKIFMLFGVMFGIIFILTAGYFIFAKFLKPTTEPEIIVENNEATTTFPEVIPATTTPIIEPVPVTPVIQDNDNDGLTNDEEKTYGTNLNSPDSDSDGLSDRDEVMVYKTDPLNSDTDGDGYLDGEEVRSGADPKGPGRLNALPGQATSTPITPTPPSQPLQKIDTDGDNLPDEDELKYHTDILNPDTDKDGLTDYNEILFYKTNPLNPDSDGDGYLDGVEVKNGFNPLGEGKLAQ
jgi:hypothetical protein